MTRDLGGQGAGHHELPLQLLFTYSIFPYDPYRELYRDDRPVWTLKGTVIEKRFWMTERGTEGHYRICRGTYTGDKTEDDVVILPLSVIESICAI